MERLGEAGAVRLLAGAGRAGAAGARGKWRNVARRCAGDFAVAVDLPGSDGVLLGVALAHVGYRAVPLYNALPHARAFVDL